jgi:predicted RNA methylase
MKAILARTLKGVLPAKHWTYLQSVRSRNHQVRWLKKSGVLDIAKRFSDFNGSTVLHGPFAGMKYLTRSILSRHSVPMLLGSYERELHDIVDAALLCKYHLVIDVGSADGYYAVGFALKGKSPVAAFETDTRELKLCKEMAQLNKVEDRLKTYRWCSPETLRALTVGKHCFVLSDCEGYEIELFDEATVDALKMSDVLVEIHGDVYEPLRERFSKTHTVQTVVASDRSATDYPELMWLGNDAPRAVKEYRSPGQSWLYARSRAESRLEQ